MTDGRLTRTGGAGERADREVPVHDPVAAIALLDEPKRRALYELVTSRRQPMGRDEAASALGIGRELAAFHLDRLAAAGLLQVEYRRLTGRTGPGAGRPAKLYRRADADVAVSLPARDYERAAETFAEALDKLSASEVRVAVDDVAREHGLEAGREARSHAGRARSQARLRESLVEALGEAGYEPSTESTVPQVAGSTTPTAPEPAPLPSIRLQNCPYHALSASHRDLTCGMNLAWAEGVLEGLGDAGLTAELAPEPGYCCVVFKDEASNAAS
jgi:predicted ArsR family transcriptional regulator